MPVFENQLNRQFDVAKPSQVYVCDITYIWKQEGWLCLASVIDLFSRKVVSWSMSSRMKVALVCDALRMTIWLRRPPLGLIVHLARGSQQYDSKVYRNLLKAYGFIGSITKPAMKQAVYRVFYNSLRLYPYLNLRFPAVLPWGRLLDCTELVEKEEQA